MFEQIYVCCVVICKMNPIVLNNLIKFCEDVTYAFDFKKTIKTMLIKKSYIYKLIYKYMTMRLKGNNDLSKC